MRLPITSEGEMAPENDPMMVRDSIEPETKLLELHWMQ
jgi:hypothetical protein